MRKIYIVAAIFTMFFALPAAADEVSCGKFVSNMTNRTVDVFHDSKQNEVQKRKQLSTIFQEAVDTDWIGKFVLGRFWKTASADEKVQYLKIYRTYITNNYVSKFNDEDAMSVDEIKVLSLAPQQAAGQFEAKTLIVRKTDDDVHVDYLLDQTSGKCQVHDIKVEGVSLITSQRSEFGTVAGNSGVKGVIEAMQKKLDNASEK